MGGPTSSFRRQGSCHMGERSQSTPGECRGLSPPGQSQEQTLSPCFSIQHRSKKGRPQGTHILAAQPGLMCQKTPGMERGKQPFRDWLQGEVRPQERLSRGGAERGASAIFYGKPSTRSRVWKRGADPARPGSPPVMPGYPGGGAA